MGNTFIKKWVGYNTASTLGGLLTVFYFPIIGTLLVVIGQAIMLSKKVGWRGFLWLLNPFIFGMSIAAYQLGAVWGILANMIALEIVFLFTIGRFSYFIWSLIVGIPTAIFLTISRYGFGLVNNWWLVGLSLLICSFVLWWAEALYLNYIIESKEEEPKKDPEILDLGI